MSDFISRQAAIDAIHCDITVTGRQNAELVAATIGAFADRIKALPSAQQWIPCSERLPEVNERCLCTYEFNEGTCVDFGLYTKRGWFVSGVTAWMPLPKPYKAERNEE